MAKKPELGETITPADLKTLILRKKWCISAISDPDEVVITAVFTKENLPAYFLRLEGDLFHQIPPASRLKHRALEEWWSKCDCTFAHLETALLELVDADLEYPHRPQVRSLWYRALCEKCGKQTLVAKQFAGKECRGQAVLGAAKNKVSTGKSLSKLDRLSGFYRHFWPEHPDTLATQLESDNPLASVRLPQAAFGVWF